PPTISSGYRAPLGHTQDLSRASGGGNRRGVGSGTASDRQPVVGDGAEKAERNFGSKDNDGPRSHGLLRIRNEILEENGNPVDVSKRNQKWLRDHRRNPRVLVCLEKRRRISLGGRGMVTSRKRRRSTSPNTVHLRNYRVFCLAGGQNIAMARTLASLPTGSRVTDYISLGVVSRAIPREKIDSILASTGKASVRQRELPAHLVVYYVIALALYMQSSYREVLRCLLEGIQWLTKPEETVRATGKSGISQ